MLFIKYKKDLRLTGRTMGKDKDNLCRQVLISGHQTCNRIDILTKYINLFEDLKLKCTSKGNHNKTAIKHTVS